MKSKKKLLEQVYNLAFKYEAERGSCPQCVLAAIMETLDVGDPATIKAIDGLAGGTALSTKGTCGALVGGLAAISSIVGRNYENAATDRRLRKERHTGLPDHKGHYKHRDENKRQIRPDGSQFAISDRIPPSIAIRVRIVGSREENLIVPMGEGSGSPSLDHLMEGMGGSESSRVLK